ncbi:LysR family transcriptional regulator [Pseudomonas gingeri NCPPB 3146 = LMG 5327]|uniref:LysR family transcriptional regulator n=2 Tax=Pseudomonas gingeri TaxID=117681 RepID=A0A7Y8CH78_9PSED|nr:LysR substrate-binding domain-containing protein [Pseudomonas gingeri]NVZ28610.1 LysR family transcriptional regulator [Pseudomonas gingeri]NVZ62709.1 LysR family transcriptional regulator [Pseudomonas gingeri]NVZ75341.1 LysR family transcriptional regulator [Pseudomonas gingeri]NWC18132.1 LysR family transcriptional regulator [Pseudomonas gingeri]NWE45659.1 LysR family transcriptional regulator [Pseudomonas gingeri]
MQASDIEIDLLRAFIAVSETGSFTAAAEVIARSQSAVSQKIIRLEEILGLRVFERTSRALTLTADGERLLVGARRMLVHYETFLREIKAPAMPGLLRLGISENLVLTQLPKLLSRFCALYPDIQLELTTGLSNDLLTAYEAGQLDVVIAKRKISATAQRGRVIWREPLVWMAASDYEIEASRPVRLVMMRPPCAYRAIMVEALASVNREWVSACLASNLIGVQAAVSGGLGITALGTSFLQEGMKILEPSEKLPTLPSTEVAVVGDEAGTQHLVQPLVSLLTEGLMAGARLT